MSTIRSVCVYCGSSPGRSDIYQSAAQALGRSIAEAGLTLVYGGGTHGIMGAVAEGASKAGGRITGIIPRFLIRKEADGTVPQYADEVIVTEDMHTRKQIMFEKSDSFVAMPGGIGTLEEIVEIMTWAQLGRHKKPIVFANIGDFWHPMLTLIDHMRAEGFIHSTHLVRPLVVDDAGEIVPKIIEAAAAIGAASGDEAVIEKM
ncbi:MAG: TIGR00730 family Rossman fold protein [Rhizobiaceae bacterium]|nr:TIGR00730 family Rossman fold protein [Rhizobiaceae bacterium]